ncbi:HAD family phosphatase [bacterium]|nr:HAD family phosphatase [bacterium]
MNNDIRMVITDLDGTLLNSEAAVSDRDRRTLELLGERGIVRVIATGRSYFSLQRVVPADFPVDYVICSSGAGILDWRDKTLLHSARLDGKAAASLSGRFRELDLDFMIQAPLPDNHHFRYHRTERANSDFLSRIDLYREFAAPLDGNGSGPGPASQFIIITGPDPGVYVRLAAELDGYEVVRTTSPLDHRSIWIEVFPAGVSKAHASQYLCDMIACSRERVLALGNDFNDLGLLRWAARSVVTANAPGELRDIFDVTSSHDDHGLSTVVHRYGLV